MDKSTKISEILKTIESLERVFDIILTSLDPTSDEKLSNDVNLMNGIQDRVEELLHEVQVIELLKQNQILN